MIVSVNQYNVLKDGQAKAFAAWVQAVVENGGGLQFISWQSPGEKGQIEIRIESIEAKKEK